MHHVYSITHPSVPESYTGVTQSLELCEYFHRISSPITDFVLEHGGWDSWSFSIVSSHELIKDARSAQVLGTLNRFDCNVPTIYKIWSPLSPEVYVGQTCDFQSRRVSHFLACLQDEPRKQKVYECIRASGDWRAWHMDPVCEYPDCRDTFELCRLERYWWKKLGATLNSNKPGSHSFKWLGSDEEFEECVRTGAPRSHLRIKEVSLDI
jgi:hypothetical protein